MLPGSNFPMVITVNGVPLLPPVMRDILEVTVNTSLHMPGMFTIRLQDRGLTGLAMETAFTYIDAPIPFMLGGLVTISAVSGEPSLNPIPQPLIVGEITAIEAEFGSDGESVLVVRGYDKSHRLHVGKKTFTYLMMPDNLIVTKVCASAGVPVMAAPTGGPREYVLQNNQTDWEFIQGLAERNGFDLVMNKLGVLQFKPRGIPTPGVPARLTWGQNLLSFNPRVSASGQVTGVTVQGWDPKLKFPIQGMFVTPPPTHGGATVKVDFLAAKIFGPASKETISDQPLAMAPEAMAVAKAHAQAIGSQFVQADGECFGDPSVQAGSPILVMGVGVRFAGPYLVSSATHSYTDDNGYLTTFSITGSQTDTISGLLKDKDGARDGGRAMGVVVGVVTNNMDPLQLGRVKVRFPHLGNLPPVESNWCRIAAPGGAGGMMSGFYWIPEINDEVLVAFEHGDVNFPYVVGTLWNNLDRPPMPSSAVVMGGKVMKKIIQTRGGHQIVLDDTPGRQTITFQDKLMMSKIEIDATKKAVSIFNPVGDVNIDCLNFKVKAAANVEIMALAKMDLKATAAFDITAAANLKLKAVAQVDVMGVAGVKLSNGPASIAMMGPIVNVNNGALEVM